MLVTLSPRVPIDRHDSTIWTRMLVFQLQLQQLVYGNSTHSLTYNEAFILQSHERKLFSAEIGLTLGYIHTRLGLVYSS